MTFREQIDALDEAQTEKIAKKLREIRDNTIKSLSWRYERHAREIRLGLDPTDDIAVLDNYAQELADVPQQPGFPKTVNWPTLEPFERDYNNIDYSRWWLYLAE